MSASQSRTRERDLTLMAHVARKHYVGGMSKSDIAEQLFLSRFKVARLLQAAHDEGIVQITVNLPGDLNLNLSREMEETFRLRHVVVIDDGPDPSELAHRLGEAAVSLLAQVIREGDLVGLASTRTLMGIADTSAPIPRCTFVQLTGQLPRVDAADVIGSIRSLTRMSGGRAHVFYAPMIASSEGARRSYMVQPEVCRAFELFPQLDVFVSGVGTWRPALSVIYDHLPPEVRHDADERGAVAEVVGMPIDSHGRTVPSAAHQHVVAPDIEMLSQARERIAVVFDERKAESVHLALRHHLMNGIVTHRSLAEAVLAL
ncbi:DeoR family transcriptional regulator [Haloactinopolyspora alba]|uniref:DeoR family transcriptional regulator n=1 Tax=Haloactinopolyspora alba TaxID=648780 RepID=A0A2P8EC38_9ACTN|nr:sugar-binding domain-containing protein [Haloactinopolyspora alba]PSL07039.1 DeoR family transcriptional regulator [Haloactinopolyspora alba]